MSKQKWKLVLLNFIMMKMHRELLGEVHLALLYIVSHNIVKDGGGVLAVSFVGRRDGHLVYLCSKLKKKASSCRISRIRVITIIL